MSKVVPQTDSLQVVEFGEGLAGHVTLPGGAAGLDDELGQVERGVEGSGLNVTENHTRIVNVNIPHIQLSEQSCFKICNPLKEKNGEDRFFIQRKTYRVIV